MTDEDFAAERQLCVALYNASRAIQGAYRPMLDHLGLTYSQYTVMLVLWEKQSVTLRDLGAALHLDSGTLSPMVKRLEKSGLVERRRSTEDERVLHVSITPEGQALRDKSFEAQQVVEAKTGLDRHEVVALREQLNELAAHLRES